MILSGQGVVNTPLLYSQNFENFTTSLSMTTWIKSDGVFMLFTQGRPTTKTWRELPRKLNQGEKQEEQIYQLRIQHRHFLPEFSQIYQYMKSKIPEPVVPHEVFLCLGWFFASNLHLNFPREAYRRKTTTIYWLNQHYDQIMNFFHTHEVKICYKTFILPLN